jgi:hypothetical protein
MDKLTQACFLDDEIKLATAKINELVSTNAGLSELESAQARLQQLLGARKDYLYQPKSPAHFIDRVLSEHLHEDRQRVASELEASVIDILLKLNKESKDIQDRSIPYEELWQDILAVLRYFKHSAYHVTAEESLDQGEWIGIAWGHRPGLSIHELCSGLVPHKWIDSANSNLLEFVLEDPKKARSRGIIVDWNGSKRSLTTFLMVSQYLDILNKDEAKPKMRNVFKDDGFTNPKYPTPPIADIISKGFSVRGQRVQNSDISRVIQKSLIVELDSLKTRVTFLADLHMPAFANILDMTWDDVLSCLFALRSDPTVNMVELVGDFRFIDFSVLRFLHGYLDNYGKDRHNVGPELESFS